MTRGLFAPLSFNEEVTLRMIAQGVPILHGARTHDIARLKKLGLVEHNDTGLGLTDLGRQRADQAHGAPPQQPTPDGATEL